MWNRKYVKLQGITKHRSSTGSESWILGICIIMEELPTGNLWALPIVPVPQKASQRPYGTPGAGKPGSVVVMGVLKHPRPGGPAPASLDGQELSGGTTNCSGLGVVSGPAGRNTAAVFLKGSVLGQGTARWCEVSHYSPEVFPYDAHTPSPQMASNAEKWNRGQREFSKWGIF